MKLSWITLLAVFLIAGSQLLLAEDPPPMGPGQPIEPIENPGAWIDEPFCEGGCIHGTVYGKLVIINSMSYIGRDMDEPCVGAVSGYRFNTDCGSVDIWLTPSMVSNYEHFVGSNSHVRLQYSFSRVAPSRRVFHPCYIEP
jgi:hypothetical protein